MVSYVVGICVGEFSEQGLYTVTVLLVWLLYYILLHNNSSRISLSVTFFGHFNSVVWEAAITVGI